MTAELAALAAAVDWAKLRPASYVRRTITPVRGVAATDGLKGNVAWKDDARRLAAPPVEARPDKDHVAIVERMLPGSLGHDLAGQHIPRRHRILDRPPRVVVLVDRPVGAHADPRVVRLHQDLIRLQRRQDHVDKLRLLPAWKDHDHRFRLAHHPSCVKS